tara:strand:- start:3191 stop:5749 length:2559 start_codon:yes stop_codon:yes gene_type:complete
MEGEEYFYESPEEDDTTFEDNNLDDNIDFVNFREDDEPLQDEVEDDYYISEISSISEELNNINDCRLNVTLDYIVQNKDDPSLSVYLNSSNHEGFCKKILQLKYEFYEKIKETPGSINTLKSEYNKEISNIARRKIKKLEKKLEYLSQFIDDFDIAFTIDKLKKLVIDDSKGNEEKMLEKEEKIMKIYEKYIEEVEIKENLIYSGYFHPYMNNAHAFFHLNVSKDLDKNMYTRFDNNYDRMIRRLDNMTKKMYAERTTTRITNPTEINTYRVQLEPEIPPLKLFERLYVKRDELQFKLFSKQIKKLNHIFHLGFFTPGNKGVHFAPKELREINEILNSNEKDYGKIIDLVKKLNELYKEHFKKIKDKNTSPSKYHKFDEKYNLQEIIKQLEYIQKIDFINDLKCTYTRIGAKINDVISDVYNVGRSINYKHNNALKHFDDEDKLTIFRNTLYINEQIGDIMIRKSFLKHLSSMQLDEKIKYFIIYGLRAHTDMLLKNIHFDRKKKIIIRDGIKIIASFLTKNRINEFYEENEKKKEKKSKKLTKEELKKIWAKYAKKKIVKQNDYKEFVEYEKKNNKKNEKIIKILQNNKEAIFKKGELNFYKCLINEMLKKRKKKINTKMRLYNELPEGPVKQKLYDELEELLIPLEYSYLLNLSSVKDFNRSVRIEEINKITEEYKKDLFGNVIIQDDGYKELEITKENRNKKKYILDSRLRTPISLYNFKNKEKALKKKIITRLKNKGKYDKARDDIYIESCINKIFFNKLSCILDTDITTEESTYQQEEKQRLLSIPRKQMLLQEKKVPFLKEIKLKQKRKMSIIKELRLYKKNLLEFKKVGKKFYDTMIAKIKKKKI